MSLEVYLISYKGGSVQGDRIVRASFRGKVILRLFYSALKNGGFVPMLKINFFFDEKSCFVMCQVDYND